ncbi:MAG: response regulator transcription factor [Tissierellia bacterium]|nr:response regulator transcription factor [Tissierellia bacterium]
MKILMFDDDKIILNALEIIMSRNGIDVLATASDGRQAKELYEQYEPDVVLMDIRMGDSNGIEASKEILAFDSKAKILLLTTFKDDGYISEALKVGVKGYILKENIENIIPSIKAIYSGSMVFDKEIIDKMSVVREKNSDPLLTDRENEILYEIAQGLNNKEIAKKLFLSEGTVRNYISNLLEKLNLRDRTQLAIHYYKN